MWKCCLVELPGINHGVGSQADKAFLALETNAEDTAYFHADDPREANYTRNGEALGFPMQDALWRYDHLRIAVRVRERVCACV